METDMNIIENTIRNFISNGHMEDAKRYIDKYATDRQIINKLAYLVEYDKTDNHELDKIYYIINQYILNIGCLLGCEYALHHYGTFYDGFDCDDRRLHGFHEPNSITGHIFYELAGKNGCYASYINDIHMCLANADIIGKYPIELINHLIKNDLLNAIKLYEQHYGLVHDHDYYDQFGYIFKEIPKNLLDQIIVENPLVGDFIKRVN